MRGSRSLIRAMQASANPSPKDRPLRCFPGNACTIKQRSRGGRAVVGEKGAYIQLKHTFRCDARPAFLIIKFKSRRYSSRNIWMINDNSTTFILKTTLETHAM
jgi:hypothetical protein